MKTEGTPLSIWQTTVVTLFPEMFPGPLNYSLVGKALKEKVWSLETINIRDFAVDKHGSVDDIVYGGGPGMVMRPDVIDAAITTACSGERPHIIYLSPRGAPLKQERVKQLAELPKVVMVCGRFEGIDQRVLDTWGIEEISLGDFILTGAEVAAMALIEACVRVLPGVVGDKESLEDESFSAGLLEYPHYTRPAIWQGREVPEVLISGHHANIQAWRQAQAEKITRERRPDLWTDYVAHRQPRDNAKRG